MNRLPAAVRLAASALALFALASAALPAQAPPSKPMSFHNRLLLNRHVVTGYRTLEVLLLLTVDQFDKGLQTLAQLGGRVRRTERSIGYVRAVVPTQTLVELVDRMMVDAYQISSLSEGGWYRDGRPQENAELLRGQEATPVIRPPSSPLPDRPRLTVDAAHRISRAADREVGIDEWLSAHPTYDGRGVTIALLESAQLEFEHPAFQSAKTLDGTDVPKFAGIINATDIDEPDETRIELATTIEATTPWHRVGARTFILPGQGRYLLGAFKLPAGGTLVHEFAVLRNDATNEIRVDTDGDADFREEIPIAPSATRVNLQHLHIASPLRVDIAFAVTEGPSPRHVHIYLARQGHQTMTASVAAGNRSNASLAYGVAPAARILLVRMNMAGGLQAIEAYIDAMQRSDVDIVDDSMGFAMLPDTSADFMGLFVSRLIAAYGKPVVHGAGNAGGRLSGVSPLGEAFAVGGTAEPASFAALYGGGELTRPIVDPRSAFGPALDGALKPDFLVPMSRLAAGVFIDGDPLALPRNAPTANVPVGYRISCCTSASSPYAAGVIGLLLSAAKQAHVPYTVESLGRALRASARFLPGLTSYEQGNGLLQVNAAWTELRRVTEPPRITVTGPNAHVLTPYAAAGPRGPGLFEREGWRTGLKGERALMYTRMSGTTEPETYRLTWTGNDGTFRAPPFITLPLRQATSLVVRIHPRTPGAHGAILNLHDPVTDAIIGRSQATVVAAEQFNGPSQTIEASGMLPPLRSATHYVAVPSDATAMRVVLRVTRGAPRVSLLPGDGQGRDYYFQIHPAQSRAFPPGEYSLILPAPSAGTWGVMLANRAAVTQADSAHVSDAEAFYALSVQLLKASVKANRTPQGSVAVDITNAGAALRSVATDVSTGSFRTHHGRVLATGMPHQIAIDVPQGAATLMLRLRSSDPRSEAFDMFLYDCTSGECFNYDFTLPSGPAHTFVVRKPKTGRWIAAINSAPLPTRPAGFTLEEIITSNVQRHESAHNIERPHGATWREVISMPSTSAAPSGATSIVLIEVVDAAAERDALANPWENRPELPNLAERPVAVGTAILPVP